MKSISLHVVFAVTTISLLACSQEQNDVTSAGGENGPAHVENAVPEAALATVYLSPDAIIRLGIETATIDLQQVQKVQPYAGEIQAAPGADITVIAPFDGRIVDLAANFSKLGSLLEIGSAVLSILPLPALNPGVNPWEDLTLRTIELENARRKLTRTTELLGAQAASIEEQEQAALDLARAEAGLKIAQAQIDEFDAAARDSGTALTINSPRSGSLVELLVGSGQIVNVGQPLFHMTSLDRLQLRVPVLPGEAETIGSSAVKVRKLGSSIGPMVTARFITGPPTASALTASIDLYYELDNANNRFRPGERVEVHIPLTNLNERLVVPLGAIFTDIYGGNWVYLSSAEGTYARTRVVVDYLIGSLAILISGPAAGASVVSVGVAELAGTEFGVGH